MTMLERVAMAINGPHYPLHENVAYTLDQLRQRRWAMLTESEQKLKLIEAKAAIEAIHKPMI